MDKIKKKLNNSASLGKTISRGCQPHSKSFFVDPVESANISLKKKTSIKQRYGQSESTSKVSSVKPPMKKTMNLAESISKIQQNRKYCSKMNEELHSSMIEKSLKVNKLLREVHHFSICVEELKWLLTEGDKLIQSHLKQTQLISPESSYTQDVLELAKEFKSLVLRFGSIDKVNLKSLQEQLRKEKQSRVDNIGFSSFQETKVINLDRKHRGFGESETLLRGKEENKDDCYCFPSNHSVPLKQNVNKENFSVHFENIKIVAPKQMKDKANEQISSSLRASSQVVNLEEEFEKQKHELYSKLKTLHDRNQELSLQIDLLKDDLCVKDGKISHYKIMSTRSVNQMGEVLRRLVSNLSKSQKEFQLLKMAQCLNNWEKMLEDEMQDIRFNALYNEDKDVNLERTQKLQEIIGLQYDINNLLEQKKHLEHEQTSKRSFQNCQDETYRLLVVQAVSIEELCHF